MLRRSPDLIIVCLAALNGVLAQVVALPVGLRWVFGAPLLLLWPGYALTAALFPRWKLGWIERLIFSLGLSLMAGSLGAVILNWSPSGLTAATWTALAGGVTLAASLAAYWRRRDQMFAGGGTLPAIGSGQLALLALAVLMTVGAVSLSRAPVHPADVQGYTMLWLTPETDGGPPRLRLGVRSAEQTIQSYRLELTARGVTVAQWPDFRVAPGQTWESSTIVVGGATANGPIEARLYRNEEPGVVYRRVSWWGPQ
jgi:hypothetical protein